MIGNRQSLAFSKRDQLETNLASRWEGVRLPPASGKSPDFPGSFPNFPGSFSATSPDVLSLWNETAIQRFPGTFPNFPGSSPNFPGSSRTSPEVSPFLWEAWHPLLTLKNFLWVNSRKPFRSSMWDECWTNERQSRDSNRGAHRACEDYFLCVTANKR